MTGVRPLYSYDNLASQEGETCGQAAIATMLDYFDRSPFKLKRVVPGQDGRLHYDNTAFVGAITHRYPPTNYVAFKASPPELIVEALNGFGLHATRVLPPDGQAGDWARRELETWLARARHPLLALIDMQKWMPQAPWYSMHWAVIYACGPKGVSVASWHENHQIDWSVFMSAWHCEGLFIHDLQFVQIHVRP